MLKNYLTALIMFFITGACSKGSSRNPDALSLPLRENKYNVIPYARYESFPNRKVGDFFVSLFSREYEDE